MSLAQIEFQEKARRDLEAAQQGISHETGQRWEAEDEILHLQSEIDQVILFKKNCEL